MCTLGGIIGKAVFQIDCDRQVGGGDDRPDVGQGVVQGQAAIGASLGKSVTGAGGRQRLETQAGEYFRRTCIPRIGDHKSPLAFVQGSERLGSKGLRIHWQAPVGKRVRCQSKPSCSAAGSLYSSGSAGKPGSRSIRRA
ncbi:hypothetical protein D3C84_920570 [compost metagenome]